MLCFDASLLWILRLIEEIGNFSAKWSCHLCVKIKTFLIQSQEAGNKAKLARCETPKRWDSSHHQSLHPALSDVWFACDMSPWDVLDAHFADLMHWSSLCLQFPCQIFLSFCSSQPHSLQSHHDRALLLLVSGRRLHMFVAYERTGGKTCFIAGKCERLVMDLSLPSQCSRVDKYFVYILYHSS